ncbi:MAG: pyruvate, phosphate dikinase [Phycicoccus sp.]|nr:pyruvate, phosphate dikinase [Phycicoccus sp.]NMM33336.1 pyruvate, phosphate dikinase [Phycicoccus sp.]
MSLTVKSQAATAPFVVAFADGDMSMSDLMGGKGANLAEMTRIGLPVPHGFTITTAACRHYLTLGREPEDLDRQVGIHLAQLESMTGRQLGNPADPLLVSVRSGAKRSMPGMMETVLNVGLTDAVIPGLIARGGERFAWDCYRRLVQMYGRTVLGVDGELFEVALVAARREAGVVSDTELDAASLKKLTTDFRRTLVTAVGEDLPQDPREQIRRTIDAVFASWNVPRAMTYRKHQGIGDDAGTAVNIVEMVYGNTGPASGSGVCFTRDPSTGEPGVYGDYLPNAQGEDVVNGSRTPLPLQDLADHAPAVYQQLMGHLRTLETHYRDLCDVEFTVEDGTLWVLQTRVGKRSPAAAFTVASAMVSEGLIDLDEALRRVDGYQLESLLHPRFMSAEGELLLATGLAASPGAAVGEVVFDAQTAVSQAAEGRDVVLMRTETSADDVGGMLAAVAIVTARGGRTSHAAVVARGIGRTCVAGVDGLVIDLDARTAACPGGSIKEGDTISVDGTTGKIFRGALAVRQSQVAELLEKQADDGSDAEQAEQAEPVAGSLAAAVLQLLAHADHRRLIGVRANAETSPDALRARRLGAEGIGLCRTEHMLLGERAVLVEHMVLGDESDRAAALADIEELAHTDFLDILRAMDGLPVVVRLLDPPLHEFLPDLTELSVEVALNNAPGGTPDPQAALRLDGVRRWHEGNPMLGLRGVRLLTVVPELIEAQVRALATATLELRTAGMDPHPELMVPLVADPAELTAAAARMRGAIESACVADGTTLKIPIGVMIELPRAALTADRLALDADFFSFGTNDLTQTTWGMSRDDAEGAFLAEYRESGLLDVDPFMTLDDVGVGRLVRIAVEEGRRARPDLGLGVCGEHAGDPISIRRLVSIGVDYVSCSPPRVPIARLEGGRAVVLAESQSTP